MHGTRIFMNGASQAVRLPAEYRFDTPDVCITRIGSMVVIFPKEEAWNLFESAIGSVGDDFSRPAQGALKRASAALDPRGEPEGDPEGEPKSHRRSDQLAAPTRGRIYRGKSTSPSKASTKRQRRSA